MLTADQIADRRGVSCAAVRTMQDNGGLLALAEENGRVRFPKRRVDEHGAPCASLPRLFEVLGGQP